MQSKPNSSRRLFLLCGVILLVVAGLLAVGVIPAVKADTYERANPEMAATAFLVNVLVALALAAVIMFGGVPLKRRTWPARTLLGLVGFIVLIAGLCLIDATAAFGSHGPHMKLAQVFMGLAAAGEIVAGALVIWASLRRGQG